MSAGLAGEVSPVGSPSLSSELLSSQEIIAHSPVESSFTSLELSTLLLQSKHVNQELSGAFLLYVLQRCLPTQGPHFREHQQLAKRYSTHITQTAFSFHLTPHQDMQVVFTFLSQFLILAACVHSMGVSCLTNLQHCQLQMSKLQPLTQLMKTPTTL